MEDYLDDMLGIKHSGHVVLDALREFDGIFLLQKIGFVDLEDGQNQSEDERSIQEEIVPEPQQSLSHLEIQHERMIPRMAKDE